MGVVTGLVLYAIIWFMTLLIVLQTNVVSQDEAGRRVKGTHGSAPDDPQLGRRFLLTSGIAFGHLGSDRRDHHQRRGHHRRYRPVHALRDWALRRPE
jgi:hypothetical protein